MLQTKYKIQFVTWSQYLVFVSNLFAICLISLAQKAIKVRIIANGKTKTKIKLKPKSIPKLTASVTV